MKNNKLIAEFMGWELEQTLKGKWVYAIRQNVLHLTKEYEETNFYLPKELLYHKSWDWLMPVVDKIENLHYGFEIIGNYVKVLGTPIYSTRKTKIQAVYNAVVEFIKWYNQNNKN